nr:MAG TPA: hypothetical protein [Caudoviricetes sp.]DAW53474.1 MAG TPA: hypothetical protein [Caudoviricetes sp.]
MTITSIPLKIVLLSILYILTVVFHSVNVNSHRGCFNKLRFLS